MNVILWVTVGLIVGGFIALASMKKGMENRVALAIENENRLDSKQISTKPVIWWIWGAVLWGIVSIFLMVWYFSVYV